MNTLYKGYIKTKGKKAIEAFKDRTKYRTYDEVKNLEGFGGVLADDTILIDIDDAEQSEILMNIVEEYQLDCRVYCTSRGRHFLFKNHSITRNRTHVPLIHPCGRVRSAEGFISAQGDFPALRYGGFAATRGCTPCAASRLSLHTHKNSTPAFGVCTIFAGFIILSRR